MRNFHFSRLSAIAAAMAIALFACAAHAEATNPRGQWIGSTQTEGQRDADKTTLSLGPVDAESATLSIDTGRACKLRDGTYSPHGDAAWSLRFKPTEGTNTCDRLSQSEFVLRAAGPRKLALEVTYPDGNGGQIRRSGVLARYP